MICVVYSVTSEDSIQRVRKKDIASMFTSCIHCVLLKFEGVYSLECLSDNHVLFAC